MIDTLTRLWPKALARWAQTLSEPWGRGPYALVTLHRPSNVDVPDRLKELMSALADLSRDLPLVFPIHPRTRKRLHDLGLEPDSPDLHLIDPLGYLDFLALQGHAAVVITDSGGMQEETTFLGVPCITVRTTTERPVTCTLGTNTLVGEDTEALRQAFRRVLECNARRGAIPPLWDGRTAERIAGILQA